MAIIKCKMCGGDLILHPNSTTAECEYCGTIQTVPSADNEKKLTLFARANRLRMASEFDKAAGVYEAIIADFPEEAEAYWGLVLCKYGIEYVDDPGSGKKVPTCHRSSFDAVMDDSNFEQASENADVIARKVYRDEAKQIEEIRKAIIEVSSKEDPYDIFICYKETDINGNRTLDSVLAQDIYSALTEKGYRVFFSRITLEDKLGQEYEPYIFAALNSAKIMLAVGTDYEHYNAVWVKNEWSRFLHMISAGQKKTLIPCYKSIDAYDMPKEFAKLQAQDLGKIGAMQDLLRGIEKILSREARITTHQEPINAHFIGNNIAALLSRGNMALEDGEWQKADAFFEEVLNQDAECGEAYFGKYLAAEKLHSMDALIAYRLERTESALAETLKACPRNVTVENEACSRYVVPGYLEKNIIIQKLNFSCTYSSELSARKQHMKEEQGHFSQNRLLSRAQKYATGSFATRYEAMQKTIVGKMRERIQLAEQKQLNDIEQKKREYDQFIKKALEDIVSDYTKACERREHDYIMVCEMQHSAADSSSARTVMMKFEALQKYKDCEELADKWRKIVKEYEETEQAARNRIKEEKARLRKEAADREIARIHDQIRKKKRKNRIIFIALTSLCIVLLIYVFAIVPAQKYQKACTLLNDGFKDEALVIFEDLESRDYKDASIKIKEIKYSKADEFFAVQNYENARKLFKEIWDYKDAMIRADESGYFYAEYLLTNKDYDAASEAFLSLNDYMDAEERAQNALYQKAEWLVSEGSEAKAAMLFATLNGYADSQDQSKKIWNNIAVRETISAGDSHAACVKNDSTVDVAGKFYHGEDCVSGWSNIVAISAGQYYTVGLKDDGTVCAVGDNSYGQCNVSVWSDIVSISAGYYHVVGLKADGTVVAAGRNESDECEVNNWREIIAVSAGYGYTVGLKADGTIVSAGNYPEEVDNWSNIIAIDANYDHVVGLKSNGYTVAAGDNYSGESNVSNWSDINAVSAGETHTVGLKGNGTVIAIGNTFQGQCKVDNWKDIVAISAGGYFTLGLKEDGTVIAVGSRDFVAFDVSSWRNVKLPE